MNRLVAVLYAFLLAVPLLQAQGTATILGTVTDPSGATVSEAQVTVVNQSTQFTRTVESNAGGDYVASELPTGT